MSQNEEGSLAELFARDPFSYSQQDIQKIIQFYREARPTFLLGGKAPSPKINLTELGMEGGPTRAVTIDQFKRGDK